MSGHTPWREIKHKKERPTQVTPKGLEIPVPTRKEIKDALGKIIGPVVKKKP